MPTFLCHNLQKTKGTVRSGNSIETQIALSNLNIEVANFLTENWQRSKYLVLKMRTSTYLRFYSKNEFISRCVITIIYYRGYIFIIKRNL